MQVFYLRGGLVAVALLLACGQSIAAPQGYGDEYGLRSYNLAHGRVVFTEGCLKCHSGGLHGAPRLNEAKDWLPRLQQPLSTLIAHATEGHGRMPAKGNLELSDQDVAAAVAYVVHHSRLLLQDPNLPPPAAVDTAPISPCGAEQEGEGCAASVAADPAILNMLLLLVGQDRWK